MCLTIWHNFKQTFISIVLFVPRLSTEEVTRWGDSFDILLSNKCELTSTYIQKGFYLGLKAFMFYLKNAYWNTCANFA